MESRWLVGIAGLLVMTILGSIYSWSLFTQPLIASFGWSNITTTGTFALSIFFLGLGALAGGRWQDRVGPRKVALAGVVMWGMGNILAGIGTPYLGAWWMYASYGVIGGFGVGMGYVTPVAVVTKWFPDRRGLGSGMVVMGFGLGAVIYNLIVKSVPSFAAAAAAAADHANARAQAVAGHVAFDAALHTLSLPDMQAVMDVFVLSGIAFLVLGCLCTHFLNDPPPELTTSASTPATAANARSYSTQEMLHTRQFYLLWLMLFLNVIAGILVISNALPIMQEMTGSPPKLVATVVGGIALCNAAGRFFWGAVSDRIGRNRAFALIFVTQAAVFFVMGGLHALLPVAVAYSVILFCYGGGFGIMPSFSADYFGTRHMGANYGALLTAWGVAGLVGPLLAARAKDMTGSFSGVLPVVAGMLLIAAVLPLITRRPALSKLGVAKPSGLPRAAPRNEQPIVVGGRNRLG
ncbi:MAG: OFA family MFS transporter [Vicinamibacterales bacterium]